MSRERLPAIAAFGLLAFVYLLNPASYDLWNPNEPLRAQAAREMLRSGNLLTLTLNDQPYYDKPPLWYWTVALCSWPAGDVTETSARLPSILAVLGLFVLVARWVGGARGLLAAAILCTSPMLLIHPYLGRAANMDGLLCLLTTGSVLAFWRGRWVAAGLLCGLAILTKGIPGLLVPAIGFAAGVWAFKGSAARAAGALGLGLAVTALWYVPAALAGGEAFVNATLVDHIFRRVTEPRSHQRGPFYFLTTFPIHFFPWILLLPAAWLAGRRRADDPTAAACAWTVLIGLAAFSVSGSKRELYILPLFPFAAILVARYLQSVPDRRPMAVVGTVIGLAALAAPPAAPFAIATFGEDFAAAELSALEESVRVPLLWTSGVLLAPAALAAAFWARRTGTPAAWALSLCGFWAVAAIPVHQRLFPAFDAVESARPAAALMKQHARPGERWVQFRIEDHGLIFYADHPMEIRRGGDSHECEIFSGPAPILCLTTHEGLGRITATAAPRAVTVLGHTAIGSKRPLVLVRWTP